MIRINLIPEPEKRDVRGVGQLVLGLLVIVALFAVLAALHVMQGRRIEEVNRKIARAEKRIEELETIKEKVDDFKAKNEELNRRIDIIKVLESNRTGPLFVMDALAEAIPNKAWLDEFTEKGLQARLVGIADNEFTVADFMKSLESSPYFVSVELGVIKKTEIRKLDLRNFIINAKLDYAGKKKTEAAETGSVAPEAPDTAKKGR
ncbi:MAG TPA: PilN domain-containing protein [Thermodesulfobacteriota bacterium]|nr:PilN domain-containing protein [Thermodesulfobacteriota bacterium]